ncbi:hypothetical protein LZ32DRAFT_642173 [Colletotrichum eremochloae]|nr:hypothetical protein LZ32DRAFT_642173 [Colletotrichum eremochloae]
MYLPNSSSLGIQALIVYQTRFNLKSLHTTAPISYKSAVLTSIMRALRYYNPGDLRLEHDVPEPVCADYQVKIKPAFVGICGTDLHEYSSSTFIPERGQPHPVTGETRPVTIGHEISGIVVEPTVCCFECPSCKEGYYTCCSTPGFLGLSGGGGGMSDAICVHSEFVHRLPDDMPLDIGVLVEPLATAWRAVVESDIKPGANVLILGAGPIGLGVIQCCKAKGATTIVVAEVADERQAMAKSFGATHVFNPLDVDLVAAVKAASPDGQGSIASFDCAGLQSTLQAACLATRPRGMVINVAIWEKEVLFNPNLLIFGERKFHSVLGYSQDDFRNVITAMKDGLLKPDAMITRKITIDRVVEDGFEALIKDKKKHIKIQVDLSVA